MKKLVTVLVAVLLVIATFIPTYSTASAATKKKTVLVKHFKGTTAVPANPKKVVVLSHVTWEGSLLSVGVKPYGVFAYENEFAPHLKKKLKGTLEIPYRDEVEPEMLISLRPDLIIMSDRYAKIYDKISKVIPTVVIEVGGDWREDHLKLTESVNKLKEGKAVLKKYDRKALDVGVKIKKKFGKKEVMAVSIGKRDIRVYGRTNHAVNALLYDEMKLVPADGIPADFGENISIEGLAKYNPDYIFDFSYFTKTDYYKSVKEGKVWGNLKAVKNKNVYTMSTTWGLWDPIERELAIDEIAKAFDVK